MRIHGFHVDKMQHFCYTNPFEIEEVYRSFRKIVQEVKEISLLSRPRRKLWCQKAPGVSRAEFQKMFNTSQG